MNRISLNCMLILIVLLVSACEKEKPLETDPAKIIIGKWQQTMRNNVNVDMPNSYIEFLSDSINIVYHSDEGSFTYWKYWVDSILTQEFQHESGNIIRFKSDYTFSNKNNQMELTILDWISNITSLTYKRIN